MEVKATKNAPFVLTGSAFHLVYGILSAWTTTT